MTRQTHGSDDANERRLSRRQVLGGGAALGLGTGLPGIHTLAERPGVGLGRGRRCIFLLLAGGPSQLDTFDPKPDAPSHVRGPFAAIRTNIPGVQVSELLPRTACHADKFAILRAVHHSAAAIHETGYQLLQTGRLASEGVEHPHVGCLCGAVLGADGGMPAHVLLPGPIGPTGVAQSHGQTAGWLGREHEPATGALHDRARSCDTPGTAPPRGLMPSALCGTLAHGHLEPGSGQDEANHGGTATLRRGDAARRLFEENQIRTAFDLEREPAALRDAYGRTRFGQNCLLARRLVEAGARFVTVNMFTTLAGAPTWDCHGSAPFSPLACYRDRVAPVFDAAFSTLLADLHARGLLADTLVVAGGEFGRTPRINRAGGRDHWTHCWSMLMAGGGVQGGRVIGASDRIGAFPIDRPVTPAEVAATICHRLGMDVDIAVAGPAGQAMPLWEPGVKPIRELF